MFLILKDIENNLWKNSKKSNNTSRRTWNKILTCTEVPSNIAILGRYIITPAVFDILEEQAPGKGGEIQLTDALKTLATHEAIYAYNFEGKRYDVGDKLGFLEATIDFALKRPGLREKLIEFLKSKKELQDKKFYIYNNFTV